MKKIVVLLCILFMVFTFTNIIAQSTKLPYPIIFVHGLNSNDQTWSKDGANNDLFDYLRNSGLSYGGRINVTLDYNRSSTTFNNTKEEDVHIFTTNPIKADFYTINFDVHASGIVSSDIPGFITEEVTITSLLVNTTAEQFNVTIPAKFMVNDIIRVSNEIMMVTNIGDDYITVQRNILGSEAEWHNFGNTVWNLSNESNQASIAKQGFGLKKAIDAVKNVTGAKKIILVGHSMGGLAIREYLQSDYYQDDIVKVTTIGTPHLGSNADEISNLVNIYKLGIDERSDAMRDLRYNYYSSTNGNPQPPYGDSPDDAVFLFGGNEVSIVSDYLYYSYDVNANGILDENVIGLNTYLNELPKDLDYTWIISQWDNWGPNINGDLAVRLLRQFPWERYGEDGNPEIFIGDTLMTNKIHSDEPNDYVSLIRGLDEPEDYSLAYGIKKDISYSGNITYQTNYLPNDIDIYTFDVPTSSNMAVTLWSVFSGIDSIAIMDNTHSRLTSGTLSNNNPINITLNEAGNYYLVAYGTATSDNWKYAYYFKYQLTPLELIADFDVNIASGKTPLTVQFTDKSSGNIQNWEWDFNNDGATDSYEQNPNYTYHFPGTYSVKLTVSTGTNSNSILKENLITVSEDIIESKLTEAEYYFDNDPGLGNANKISVSQVSDYLINTKLDVTSLNEGIHILGFRVKDENGKWSFTYHKVFLKANHLNDENAIIIKLEYYIDEDPGYDLANMIPIISASNIDKEFSVDLTNTNNGIHTVFLRAKDNFNTWSHIYSKAFLKESFGTTKALKRLEYFIDNDPGYGNGIVMGNVSSEKDSVSFVADLKNILPGIHIFNCRAQDSENKWSMLYSKMFLVNNNSQSKSITSLEYFFDEDPGYGNGYKIELNPSGNMEVQFNAEINQINLGTHRLFIRVKNSDGVWSFVVGNDFEKIADVITTQIKLKAGWNIISVPLLATDMNQTALFPNATSDAWGFDNGYIKKEELGSGYGYWIRYGDSDSVTVTGLNEGKTSVTVKNGWNMIGFYDSVVLVNSIISEPAGIVTSAYWGFNSSYVNANTLEIGKGYWVRVKEDGELRLNPSSSPMLAKKGSQEELKVIAGITIKDASNRQDRLMIAEQVLVTESYDLPPIPPAGIFDVRWESQRKVEVGEGKKVIEISNAEYPIMLTAENSDMRIKDIVGGMLLNSVVRKGTSITITNPAIEKIEVEFVEIPMSYELYQNYPNPFNPVTTIKYALPQDGLVKLEIFNALGERVETIVDEIRQAGYHEVKWDASRISSGVYFYVISMEQFRAVKKLVLMK